MDRYRSRAIGDFRLNQIKCCLLYFSVSEIVIVETKTRVCERMPVEEGRARNEKTTNETEMQPIDFLRILIFNSSVTFYAWTIITL